MRLGGRDCSTLSNLPCCRRAGDTDFGILTESGRPNKFLRFRGASREGAVLFLLDGEDDEGSEEATGTVDGDLGLFLLDSVAVAGVVGAVTFAAGDDDDDTFESPGIFFVSSTGFGFSTSLLLSVVSFFTAVDTASGLVSSVDWSSSPAKRSSSSSSSSVSTLTGCFFTFSESHPIHQTKQSTSINRVLFTRRWLCMLISYAHFKGMKIMMNDDLIACRRGGSRPSPVRHP